MKRKVYGFTLIETALVIAIAGVIFALVFNILPSLWANERDAERRDDLATFMDTLKSYQMKNNRGALPGVIVGTYRDTPTEKSVLDAGGVIDISGKDVVSDKAGTLNPSFKAESWGGFYRDYFLSAFEDPEGIPYNLAIMSCDSTDAPAMLEQACTASRIAGLAETNFKDNNYTMYVVRGATCDGSVAVKSANARKIALLYVMESAGVACYTDGL